MKTRLAGLGGMVVVGAVLLSVAVAIGGISQTIVSNLKFYRSSTASVSGTFSPGEVVLFTNCVAYADGTGTVQDLTSCTGGVKVVTSTGTGTNNTLTTNFPSVAVDTSYTNGLFSFSVTIPADAVGGPQFQVTLGDGTNTAIYPPSRMGLVELL